MQSSSLEALSSFNLGWQAPVAWSVALFCVARARRHLKRLANLRAPEPEALLTALLRELGAVDAASEHVRRAAIADLNQRLSDVAFELGLLKARFTALARICLASGTALALFGYIGAMERPAFERALAVSLCALAGLLGVALVSAIGQMAKVRAAQTREAWDRASRETGKALGTSLASSGVRSEP